MPAKRQYVLMFRFLAILCLFIVWSPLALCKADANDLATDLVTGETAIETITVTADKREEDVQKVPGSISVLTDIAIEDSHIQSTKDIYRYIPNMATSNAGSRDYWSRIQVRGISNTAFGDPAVTLYIDDVPFSDMYAFDATLFDIERIEVLKGPQGTLYGKNTEGGAIKIVTKAPGDTFEGRIGGEIGDYNTRQVCGAINTPIIEDKLTFRFSGLASSRDGYVANLYDGGTIDNQKTLSGNASLFFMPTEQLDFNLTFRIHEYDDDGGYAMTSMEKSKYQAATGLLLNDFETAYNFSGESSSKTHATSLRARYAHNAFDLISVTTYRDMDNEGTLDADFSPRDLYSGFNGVESKTLTQELRIQSRDEIESSKWLLGVFYGDSDTNYQPGYAYGTVYANMMGVPVGAENRYNSDITSKDTAVFGQGTLRFYDNALGLTAGLRYERSKRFLDYKHTFMGTAVVPSYELEETFSEWLPKLALDYRISDTVMGYASVARGYKAGGFAYAVDDPDLAGFDPEVSTAFELGLKTELPKHGLRFNVTGFYTKVDDYQDRVQVNVMTVSQANVSNVDIYGFELEASYALTRTLRLNGFLGYTKAKYGEYIDPLTGTNFDGNRVTLIPEFDSGLILEYRNAFGLFARAEAMMFGSSYFDRDNTVKQGSYALYNMKIGYEMERFDIVLALQNLADKQYFLEAVEDSTVGYMGLVGPPRTVSLTVNYRF